MRIRARDSIYITRSDPVTRHQVKRSRSDPDPIAPAFYFCDPIPSPDPIYIFIYIICIRSRHHITNKRKKPAVKKTAKIFLFLLAY